MKCCLSIAGSDCSGGAGIQADLKTFSALGTFGMSVVVSVVAENTCRVISVQDIEPRIIEDQIDAVFEDIPPQGVKVGMLSNAKAMRVVAAQLRHYQPEHVVIDPVMIAKGGSALMHPDALETLKSEIIPCAGLLTPNIPEAEAITGMSITNEAAMHEAAREIHRMGARGVLIKGGHLDGEPTDILFDGAAFHRFTTRRIDTRNTHGTGCTYSSAITAHLAQGRELTQAVKQAKGYVTQAIRYAFDLGHGHGPTNHFYRYRDKEITTTLEDDVVHAMTSNPPNALDKDGEAK